MRRLSWRQHSLAVKLTLIMAIVVLITVALVTLISIQREQQSYRSELQSHAGLLLDTLASASADRLYRLDHAFLSDLMTNLSANRIVVAGRIYDGQGRVIADAYQPDESFGSQPDPLGQRLLASAGPMFEWQSGQLLAGRAVIAGSDRLGAISVGLSTAPLNDKMAAVRNQGIAVGLAAAIAGALLALLVSRSISGPLRVLTTATKRLADGDLTQVITVRNGDELATLATSFNSMARSLEARISAEQAARTEAERLQRIELENRHTLEQTLAELRESIAAREQLSATIRELSSPVIPVLEGILVMPLIGVIDSERAALLLNSLLTAIEQRGARVVIMDVTGVPIIDTQVARSLLHAADAARLLGTQTVLVGLRPELAQTIVGLGLNLSNLITRADLQSGLIYAMSRDQSNRAG
jgi:anti-anti-sigma regulatory factor/HAMP domain-containing protein